MVFPGGSGVIFLLGNFINASLLILFFIFAFSWKKKAIYFRPLVYIYAFIMLLSSFFGSVMIIDSFFYKQGGLMNNQQGYIVYDKQYNITLYGIEKLHPFDSCKYKKIFLALKKDKIIHSRDIITPVAPGDDTLLKMHSKSYIKKCENPVEIAHIVELAIVAAFPPPVLKKKILYPQLLAAGGTIVAGEVALKRGLCINLSGGYHHAHKDTGSGFCFFADVPLSITNLLKKKLINKALIIDTDVHHGDGNADIFLNNPGVDILDMYETHNFPYKKYPVTYDGSLMSGIHGEYYLSEFQILMNKLDPGEYDIVFYNAGADVLKTDVLGGLQLTVEDVVKRDMLVASFTYTNKIPLVMVLAGGYSAESWKAHYMSIKEIISLYF